MDVSLPLFTIPHKDNYWSVLATIPQQQSRVTSPVLLAHSLPTLLKPYKGFLHNTKDMIRIAKDSEHMLTYEEFSS